MKERRNGLLLCVSVISAVVTFAVICFPLPSKGADTLPSQLTDSEFWRLVTEMSEPSGYFPYENFVSNELQYQDVLPDLTRKVPAGGVYLGVAPEQNFTYIAALKPRMAFIIDIRRQNMIELLLYKALFEMSKDRSEFMTRLFSRRCPATVNEKSTAKELFDACGKSAPETALFEETLQLVKDRLMTQHHFQLSGDDESKIKYVFNVFFTGGSKMDYLYASPTHPNATGVPSYSDLMTVTSQGKNWAYLDSDDAYQRVRSMQMKNLIVPIVGDFAGPKAVRSIGQYLKDHGARVSVFYISNVEDYLQPPKWTAYRSNVSALPIDDSSVFIRVYIDSPKTFTAPMNALSEPYPGRSFQ